MVCIYLVCALLLFFTTLQSNLCRFSSFLLSNFFFRCTKVVCKFCSYRFMYLSFGFSYAHIFLPRIQRLKCVIINCCDADNSYSYSLSFCIRCFGGGFVINKVSHTSGTRKKLTVKCCLHVSHSNININISFLRNLPAIKHFTKQKRFLKLNFSSEFSNIQKVTSHLFCSFAIFFRIHAHMPTASVLTA